MTERTDKINKEINKLAAEFIEKETNKTSLITITKVDTNSNSSQARIYISVFPIKNESPALDFVKRQRSEIRKYIMKRSKIGRIPFIDFFIDEGEKNRQHIEKIMHNI